MRRNHPKKKKKNPTLFEEEGKEKGDKKTTKV